MLSNVIVPLADDIDIFLRVILTLLETFFISMKKMNVHKKSLGKKEVCLSVSEKS